MERIFKTRYFARWMRKTELTDQALCLAVSEMRQGLIDAQLGGQVFKKRIALAGKGKRGGARTLIASNLGNRWFFIFGFEKNVRDNISSAELEALQQLASELLQQTDKQLELAIQNTTLVEIHHDTKNEK